MIYAFLIAVFECNAAFLSYVQVCDVTSIIKNCCLFIMGSYIAGRRLRAEHSLMVFLKEYIVSVAASFCVLHYYCVAFCY